ncbi:hypothetical protein ACFPM0_08650 [Pseudonocardia sulfidoxydans]|uniref:hypothetical protein n=1 Tax=Pseudonocardia sulfidoxydans TaxID=54011 RepID=UPI00361BA7C4
MYRLLLSALSEGSGRDSLRHPSDDGPKPGHAGPRSACRGRPTVSPGHTDRRARTTAVGHPGPPRQAGRDSQTGRVRSGGDDYAPSPNIGGGDSAGPNR